MGSRKVNTEGIDEELLIASIGRRRQDGTLYHAQEPPAPAPEEESVPETEPPPVQYTAKEKPQRDTVRRKRQEDDYSGLFLRRNEIKTRQCVYISRDVHSKILKIVNDIAGREISVGGYVDTVLRQHLEQHKEKINELYKKQREDRTRKTEVRSMTAAVCLPKCRRVWKSCPPCRYAANAVRRTMNGCSSVKPK